MLKPLLLSLVTFLILTLPASLLRGQDDDRLIDSFEGNDFHDHWWQYDEGATFACEPASPGYNSERALRNAFSTGAEQYPGCGMSIEQPDRWAAAEGISFVWRSEPANLDVGLVIGIADPTQTNPDAGGMTSFEAFPAVTGEWTTVTLRWSDFIKAEWLGDSGIAALDLTNAVEIIFVMGASTSGTVWIDDLRLTGGSAPDLTQPAAGYDKFALWTNGTQLRGINVWQRVVVPHIDGSEFLGAGHVGPPYTPEDFATIARLGANYVNLSTPGLFTETPPYAVDEQLQANLDLMLAMIEEADLFAVISVRTGPGRSDFTFNDDIAEWGDPRLVYDNVWTDPAAQDAWVEMWRYMAARYRDNPIVVGYDLMVEPNGAGRLLELYDPEEFYPAYAGTTYDWNAFYPRLLDAIREVDSNTPVIIGAMGWSAVYWLPYLATADDPRVVYGIHQYEPQAQYTHQDPGGGNTYPGIFDFDYDGAMDTFDRAWLDGYLTVIDAFRAQRGGVPVVANEYGVRRWVPNAADFMRDQMTLFETRGMNHAFWVWNALWPPHNVENDAFDFLRSPDPDNHTITEDSALYRVIFENWSQNTARPSNLR